MNWTQLLSGKRFGMEEYHERKHERTDFQRDYDRLIFSSPFRRLQNKTQVFPLPGSIFVHNRLTHSLEVSCVGRIWKTKFVLLVAVGKTFFILKAMPMPCACLPISLSAGEKADLL